VAPFVRGLEVAMTSSHKPEHSNKGKVYLLEIFSWLPVYVP